MSGMTREEAIEIIKNLPVYRAELIYGGNSELAKALGMAIADMEKQIPKKAINGECPVCGELVERWDWKYCVKCGQAL